MENKTTIDTLIARAKTLANGRLRNKGRPREVMDSNEAAIVSQMRRRECSIHSIFRVMDEKGLTKYRSYSKFKAAYTNHKLYA